MWRNTEIPKSLLILGRYLESESSEWLFHDRGPSYTETSPLICSVNQWTGFYIIGTSVMKVLTQNSLRLFQMNTQRLKNLGSLNNTTWELLGKNKLGATFLQSYPHVEKDYKPLRKKSILCCSYSIFFVLASKILAQTSGISLQFLPVQL